MEYANPADKKIDEKKILLNIFHNTHFALLYRMWMYHRIIGWKL